MANNLITTQDTILSTLNSNSVNLSDDTRSDKLTQASNTLKQILPLENITITFQSLDWDNKILIGNLGLADVSLPWLNIKDTIEIHYNIVAINGGSGYNARIQKVTGTIYVLDILFQLSIGSNYFGAIMSNPAAQTVEQLLKTFMGGEIDLPLNGLTIKYASFEYQGGESKSFSLDVAVKESGKITDNFQLDNLGFYIEVDAMKFKRTKLSATCTIDSFTFSVSGEYDIDNGFTFKFKYQPDTPVNEIDTLTSLIKTITADSNFAFPADMPSSISVSYISFSFNSRTKEISFDIDANCSFGNTIKVTKDSTSSSTFDVSLSIDGSLDKSQGIPFTFKFALSAKITVNGSEIDQSIKIADEGYGLELGYSAEFTNVTVGDAITAMLQPLVGTDDYNNLISFIPDLTKGVGAWQIKHFDLSKDPQLGYSTNFKIDPDFGLDAFLTSIGIDQDNPIVKELGKYTVTDLSFRYSSQFGFSIRVTVTLTDANDATKVSKYNFKLLKKDDFLIGNFYASDGGSISLSPENFPLDLEIKDLFLAHFTAATPPATKQNTFTLFGSDLDVRGAVDLSTMEVVGHFFSEIKFKFDAVRFTYSSAEIEADTLANLNLLLNAINVSPITISQSNPQNNAAAAVGFPQGISLQGNIIIGNNKLTIPLHNSIPQASPQQGQAPTQVAPPQDKTAKPTPVGKQFGPVTIISLGLGAASGGIKLTVTGNIHIGPLEVDLIGFSIESPISSFNPTFGINGLGIKLNKAPLSIDGEFMKEGMYYHYDNSIDDSNTANTADTTKNTLLASGTPQYPISFTQYSGGLAIGINKIQIVAIGAYAKIGDPVDVTSLFIYGALSMPIAIPPIGIIESLALGFGLNRDVVIPKPEQIDSHPLIKPLFGQMPDFTAMNNNIPIKKGEDWLAFGVRLLVLDMVDALILVIVKFGDELEFDILGRAELTFPKTKEGAPALCKMIIGVVATILPERGIVAVNGSFLAGSYIYEPQVQITGGFALLHVSQTQTDGQWNGAQEGDFVMTLGGYSPLYTAKSWYPIVPRLALTWKPCDALNISAQAYMTVTPDAFMVGGKLVADFHEGGSFAISVHFELGADFVMWFKPYHYQGDAYATLNISASIDVHLLFIHIHESIELDAHADITFWGPKFAGHANVSLHFIVTFSASVDFGQAKLPPPALNTLEFLHSFFAPAKNNTTDPSVDKFNVLSGKVTKGLLAHQPLDTNCSKIKLTSIDPFDNKNITNLQKLEAEQDLMVVNAKELVLEFTTGIPIKKLTFLGSDETLSNDTTVFGISAMGNKSSDIASEFSLSVTKDGQPDNSIGNNFDFKVIYKNFPSGIWQAAGIGGIIPNTDSSKPLLNLCTGIQLTAKQNTPKDTCVIPSHEFDDIFVPSQVWEEEFNYV
jgi:hypothetical protein